jgi:hypothetical protein
MQQKLYYLDMKEIIFEDFSPRRVLLYAHQQSGLRLKRDALKMWEMNYLQSEAVTSWDLTYRALFIL